MRVQIKIRARFHYIRRKMTMYVGEREKEVYNDFAINIVADVDRIAKVTKNFIKRELEKHDKLISEIYGFKVLDPTELIEVFKVNKVTPDMKGCEKPGLYFYGVFIPNKITQNKWYGMYYNYNYDPDYLCEDLETVMRYM